MDATVQNEELTVENADEVTIEPTAEEPMPEVNEGEKPVQEVAAFQDKYLRLAAEYDNFRKRTAKERESLVSDSRGHVVLQLLPVLDNLERAATQPCTDEAYCQGVALIARQWHEIFAKLGVTAIETIGKPFDPLLHNAVMHGADESQPENTIVEEFQKGYAIGDKVLRPSMVKVVN